MAFLNSLKPPILSIHFSDTISASEVKKLYEYSAIKLQNYEQKIVDRNKVILIISPFHYTKGCNPFLSTLSYHEQNGLAPEKTYSYCHSLTGPQHPIYCSPHCRSGYYVCFESLQLFKVTELGPDYSKSFTKLRSSYLLESYYF